MERLSDMGFQKEVFVFYFDDSKDFPLIENVQSFIARYKEAKGCQLYMSVNASVALWRESFAFIPELEFCSSYIDAGNDKIHCSCYDLDLSSQLAIVDGLVKSGSKRNLAARLTEFLTIALPFAKQGAVWLGLLKPGVIPPDCSVYSSHLYSYEASCLSKGELPIECSLSRLVRSRILEFERKRTAKSLDVQKFTKFLVKRTSVEFLKGREIRHIVYKQDKTFRAVSILIRSDGTHKKVLHLMPDHMDFKRFDSYIFDIANPETFVLMEPIRWELMENCGATPYDQLWLCGKINIPVVVEECFMVVMLKHGYVRSSCSGCSCCFVYDNLISCEGGKERVDGSFIYLSPLYLEQYLQSFNRLHHKEHLFFVFSELLQ